MLKQRIQSTIRHANTQYFSVSYFRIIIFVLLNRIILYELKRVLLFKNCGTQTSGELAALYSERCEFFENNIFKHGNSSLSI